MNFIWPTVLFDEKGRDVYYCGEECFRRLCVAKVRFFENSTVIGRVAEINPDDWMLCLLAKCVSRVLDMTRGRGCLLGGGRKYRCLRFSNWWPAGKEKTIMKRERKAASITTTIPLDILDSLFQYFHYQVALTCAWLVPLHLVDIIDKYHCTPERSNRWKQKFGGIKIATLQARSYDTNTSWCNCNKVNVFYFH